MFRRLFVFTSVCVSVLVSFASLVGGVDEVSFLSFKGSPEGKILEELKRVDVFILLDGTASMRPYIHEAHRVAKAIVATFSNTSSPKESYARFGFRVYRGDYAGKNDIGENLVLPPDCNPNQKAKAIRANQDRFKQKLSKVMASTEDEKIHAPYLENLFHGLRQAVDDMAGCPEHTKLLFVIGDAGDKDLPIPDDVIQKLRSFLKPMTLFFIRTPNNEQNAYTPRAYREAYNPTATLDCVAQLCPCRIAVWQLQATRESDL